MNCQKCNQGICDTISFLTCFECNCNFHLTCVPNFTKTDYEFIKSTKTNWKCFICDKKRSTRDDETPVTPTQEKVKPIFSSTHSENSDSDISDKLGAKQKMLCNICKKGFSHNAHRALCVTCKKTFHFKCVPINKEDYDRKKSSWQCNGCLSGTLLVKLPTETQIRESGSAMMEMLNEMKQFRSEVQKSNKEYFDALSTFRQEVLTKNQEFTNSLNSYSEWIIENGRQIKELGNNLSKVIKDYEEIKQENLNLKKANDILTKRLNNLEQSVRDKTVEMYGIPFRREERLIEVIENVSNAIGFNFKEEMVDSCYRLRPGGGGSTDKPAGIVMRFSRKIDKELFMDLRRKKRNLNSRDLGYMEGNAMSVYVNDSLTPESRKLFNAARLVKQEKQFTYLWVKNGRIFMRKNTGDRYVVIESQDDLNKLQ